MKSMKVLFALSLLTLSITLWIPILFQLYSIIGIISLITCISWQFMNIITRYLLPNKSIKPKGLSVLITGCDSGFGYATALELHKKGWHVFACVLSDDSDGAKDLKSKGCTTIKLDVTSDCDVINAHNFVVRECFSRDLKLWAIVNNAGVLTCGPIEWGLMRDIDQVFQINVFGYIRIIRQFLPLIRKSRGRIINVSSVSSIFTAPGVTTYSMSKHAVTSLTDGLRRELHKTGIDLIEIIPQAYLTRMSHTILGTLDRLWKQTSIDVKTDFGEEYFEYFRSYIKFNVDITRDKAFEVVNTIVNSITSKRVHYKYLCCSPINRIIIYCLNCVPIEWIEPIIPFCTVNGKPKWVLKK